MNDVAANNVTQAEPLRDERSTRLVSRRRLALAIVGLAIAFALDWPIHKLAVRDVGRFEKRDLVQFLRTGGYLFLWLGVALALLLIDVRRAGAWTIAALRRGGTLAGSVVIAGILGELLKLLARRERVILSHAWYHYRPIWERPFETSGLSMPSSHAVVAFAAAFTLGRLFPAARGLFLLYAIGTATTRVLIGAHFPSDVYVSFMLSWCVSKAIDEWFASRDRRHSFAT